MSLAGIGEGIISSAAWTAIGRTWSRLVGGADIKITRPRPTELLDDKQPNGDGFTYAVEGILRSLPKGHTIWLLLDDEKSLRVWPQGSGRVQFDASSGKWSGRVHIGKGYTNMKVLAVVAPPTSNDYFNYYQKCGQMTNWMPLDRLPVECRNVHSVHVRVP